MAECFTASDVKELGKDVLAGFDRRISSLPEDLCEPFHDEARQLETELMCVYKATVLCVRREDDLSRVAEKWGAMVQICDDCLARLHDFCEKHPASGAGVYYDRILELRSKCLRLQEMHQ